MDDERLAWLLDIADHAVRSLIKRTGIYSEMTEEDREDMVQEAGDRLLYVLARKPEMGDAERIVCLAVDYETALQRCKKDPARPKTTRWHELLANWYRDYEPVAAAEADEMEIINAKH